jgi:hypothetical protein
MRHLLPITAFSVAANTKEALNPQESGLFPLVFSLLHRLVASL